MPEVLLGTIQNIIDTITSVPINNKTYRKVVWTLKILAQVIEIVLGGILLGTDIAPNLKGDFYLESPGKYRAAAYAYIAFFALEIILDMIFWTFVVFKKGEHEACVPVSVLLSVAFEMPIMICGVCMMKAKGTINWDDQIFELVFHIWYIVNIMLQLTFGYAQAVIQKLHYFCYLLVILLAPLSYLIACLPYAFVIIPMSGWNWFPSFSNYYKSSHDFVHGTFTSTDTQNIFDFLIVSGFVGQWIWGILCTVLVLISLYCCTKCSVFTRDNRVGQE